VTKENIKQVAALQPDLVVSGSAIFDGQAPAENLAYMLDALRGEEARTGR
jgi:pentose-5-phosphate-3-epimerase